MTTNRVGDFDEAFTSRIHISLHYPPLDRDSTDAVFEVNLNRIKKRFKTNGRKIEIEDFKVRSMAERYWRENPKARWNGRQIRNACQTALALSEFEVQGGMSVFETTRSTYNATKNTNADVTVKLGVKHFETVQLAYLSFIKYLDDVYGADADTRAKESFLRAIYREVANMRPDATNPSQWPGNRSGWQHLSEVAPSMMSQTPQYPHPQQHPQPQQQHHYPQQPQQPQHQQHLQHQNTDQNAYSYYGGYSSASPNNSLHRPATGLANPGFSMGGGPEEGSLYGPSANTSLYQQPGHQHGGSASLPTSQGYGITTQYSATHQGISVPPTSDTQSAGGSGAL